eukprot:6005991-Prymnesium_polylepis.3
MTESYRVEPACQPWWQCGIHRPSASFPAPTDTEDRETCYIDGTLAVHRPRRLKAACSVPDMQLAVREGLWGDIVAPACISGGDGLALTKWGKE